MTELISKSGALLSAIFASISCIGPLLASRTGIVGLSGLVSISVYRPYFIGLAGLTLVYSFYTTYMEKYPAGSSQAQKPTLGKEEIILSLMTLFVLGAVFLPYVKGVCPASTALTHEANGVIIQVDRSKGDIVLEHEEIRGLLPAMTMEYAIKSPSLSGILSGLKAGDRVRFRLKYEELELVVVGISKEKRRQE